MLLRQLIELVTPETCLACSREGNWLCSNCRLLVTIPAPNCFDCGRLTADGRACTKCRRRHALEGVVAGAHYEESVRELILALKFGRAHAASKPAASLLIRGLMPDVTSSIDAVTSVPVAPSRRRERGYNQSELLARAVVGQLGLPYQATLRRHGSAHQLGAGRRDRIAQVRAAFEAVVEVEGAWLIVDDVVTTGATLDACAAALRKAGATRVTGAVVAGQRG